MSVLWPFYAFIFHGILFTLANDLKDDEKWPIGHAYVFSVFEAKNQKCNKIHQLYGILRSQCNFPPEQYTDDG